MGRAKGKLSKGQPRGARSASGRKRDRAPLREVACEGVARRHALYRVTPDNDNDRRKAKSGMTDTCDALGRAYNAGLLGNDERAKDLLTAGRMMAWRYWRIYAPQFGSPDSLARFQPSEPGKPMTDDQRAESDAEHEKRLNEGQAAVRKLGHDHKRAFEQLVIDWNPDHGPAWLDRIAWAHHRKQLADRSDMAWLTKAVASLEALVPKRLTRDAISGMQSQCAPSA